MGNKEDWKEVEKSVKEADNRKFARYEGRDITENLDYIEKKNKPSNLIIKKVMTAILKLILILFALWVIEKVYVAFELSFGNMKSLNNVNVKQTIEESNGVKIKLISKNVDKNEYTGEYYFKLKKLPEIEFKAIKRYGMEKDDMQDRLHKYIFERWEDPEKSKFLIKENIDEEGLMHYETPFQFDTYEEYNQGVEALIRFLKYENNWNKENKKVINIWRDNEEQFVYFLGKMDLVKDKEYLIPYHAWFQTEEDIREDAKQQYIERFGK